MTIASMDICADSSLIIVHDVAGKDSLLKQLSNDDSGVKQKLKHSELESESIENLITDKNILKLVISDVKLTTFEEICPFFPNLCYLNLSFNNICNISWLTLLPHLKILDLSHNKINNIGEISDMLCLSVLRLHNNNISSLSSFTNLPLLTELWLSNNCIEWTELIFLKRIDSIQQLIIFGNPCDQKAKVREFIIALCPNIQNLNGQSTVGGLGANSFLKTSDGRAMMTQARAAIPQTRNGRSSLPKIPDDTSSSHAIAVRNTTESASVRTPDLESTTVNEELQEFRSTPDISSPSPTVQIFRAKKGDVTAAPGSVDATQKRLPKKYIKAPEVSTVATPVSADRSSATVIRFGSSSSSPVALCLYADRTGYVR